MKLIAFVKMFIDFFSVSPRLVFKLIINNPFDVILAYETINDARITTKLPELKQFLNGLNSDKLFHELVIFHICLVMTRANYFQLPIIFLNNYIKLVYTNGIKKNYKEVFSLESFRKRINQRYQEYFRESNMTKDPKALGTVLARSVGEDESAITIAIYTSILGNTIVYSTPQIDNILIKHIRARLKNK